MEDIIFSDEYENNFGKIYFGVDDKYTDNCSQYVMRSKIKQALKKVIYGRLDCPFLTEEECDFYIDYIHDFDNEIISSVYNILEADAIKGLQKLKKLKRCPKWAKKEIW